MKSKDFVVALWGLDRDEDFVQSGVQGNASFDSVRGVELDIPMGCLLDRELVKGVNFIGTDPITAPAAYGFCQNGDKITLINISTSGPGFSAPGTHKEKLQADSALVSKTSFISLNPIIKSMTIHFSGLWNWLDKCFGKVTTTLEKRQIGPTWSGTSGTWQKADIEEIPLYINESISMHLQPEFTCSGSHPSLQEFSMKSDIRLRIEFSNPELPLNDAMESWVFPIWKLFSFCMGFICSIDEILVTTTDGQCASYYLPLIGGVENPSNVQVRHMPLTYKYMTQSGIDLVAEWFNIDDGAKRAATVLIGMLDTRNISSLGSMFTAMVGAFEAISRVGEKTNDISKTEFKKMQEKVKESFDNENLRDWILQKMNNNPPASYYANALLDKLGVFAEYVIPDRARFLKDLRNTRNAYIHQTSALEKTSTLSDVELFTHAMAIKVLCYGAIMMQLGITPESILERFEDSQYCSTEIYRSRSMYPLDQADKG